MTDQPDRPIKKPTFNLTGAPALVLFGLIICYFYLGWKQFGGTIWQRTLNAR